MLRVVSDNEEPVEPAPSWMVTLEVGTATYAQDLVQGYPSYSGPLLAFFSTEDEDGEPVYLCPYHRVVTIKAFKGEATSPVEATGLAN